MTLDSDVIVSVHAKLLLFQCVNSYFSQSYTMSQSRVTHSKEKLCSISQHSKDSMINHAIWKHPTACKRGVEREHWTSALVILRQSIWRATSVRTCSVRARHTITTVFGNSPFTARRELITRFQPKIVLEKYFSASQTPLFWVAGSIRCEIPFLGEFSSGIEAHTKKII